MNSPSCSDRNWDPAGGHPYEFLLSTSIWRGDTGYGLLSVQDNQLVEDMSLVSE